MTRGGTQAGERRGSRLGHERERIAQEAARLMVEGGIRDFQLAKRKAAERLRIEDTGALPRNDEIERALVEYQRLFRSDDHPAMLEALRDVAAQVMRRLRRFDPRLVGPVLEGTADEHSEVSLHLFADSVEEVGFFLMDHAVHYEATERRVRFAGEETPRRMPVFMVAVQDVPVELMVFCERARREVPLSPVDGRPMRRANLDAVQGLAET